MRKQRLREFGWVGGCVNTPAAWASLPWRRGPHRQGDDAGVYTDRRKWPLGAVLEHLCTLLRRCGQPWGRRSVHRSAKTASRVRFGAFVYTVATRGSRELRRELRRVARAPQPPWCAGGAPFGGHLSLSREDRLCVSGAVARLASSRNVNPQTLEKPENSLVPPNRTVRLAGEMSRA